MLQIIIVTIIWVTAVFLAITIHEMAHALAADKLGDPTARLKGRLSLNPLVHYDPIGTTLLFVTSLIYLLGNPFVIPFGWAKPVEFDPFNLKDPKRDAALISLAGPASNLIFAFVFALVLRLTLLSSFLPTSAVFGLIELIIQVNISLAIFNLIPVHPLDGGKILVGLLPDSQAGKVDSFLNHYGTILLLFLIFPTIGGNSPISIIISPIINLLLKILIPGSIVV